MHSLIAIMRVPDGVYALCVPQVLTTGKVWGEDMILARSALRLRWCARPGHEL